MIIDSSNIEEKVNSCNEIRLILINHNKLEQNIDIEKASIAQLKGWLFKYYSKLNNLEAYHNMNKHIIVYKEKINKGISEEGYILWEQMLVLQDEYLAQSDTS